MNEKNRFSNLLEQLMQTADLKNYTLAQDLQYDVSYISKWVSGKMLPAEKSAAKVLREISHSIVCSLNSTMKQTLYSDYRVGTAHDLEMAIYDHLSAEYNYVKDLKKNTGHDIAPKTSFFLELTLPQFVSKMWHPVLRRVKSLDIMCAMDILSMEHEYRLAIAGIQNSHLVNEGDYPNVHFSMLINLDLKDLDYVYDSIFLINMLTSFANVDFQLYGGTQAYGKAMFVVRDAFAISGMLLDQNHCMSVTTTEDPEICNTLYHNLKSMFNRESLIFRRITMQDMLKNYNYIQSILSTKLRWLLGHMTEHFLPDDLFDQILMKAYSSGDWEIGITELQRIHSFTKGILEEASIQIMLYESALNDFAVSGELDFYNHKVYLNFEQRLCFAQHLLSLLKKNRQLKVKLIRGKFVSDFQYIANPCLFLSDIFSYLRLVKSNAEKNIVSFNNTMIRNLFDNFYSEIWEYHPDVVISDPDAVMASLRHIIQSIQFMSRME